MVSIHTSHRMVFMVPAGMYVILVLAIAILPAASLEQGERELEPIVAWGRDLYRTEFNCVACHTQQTRGDERLRVVVDGEERIPVLKADARFGLETPSEASEYAGLVAPLMGTQRTGPDLQSVGRRLPGAQWHHWHLYNPRSVSPDSTMPAFRYLYVGEQPEAERGVEPEQVESVSGLGYEGTELWATPKAVALVEYLLSLKRAGVGE